MARASCKWFKPSERLPRKSGARVLAHVVMAAGSDYAVMCGRKRGWQTLDIATFWRRPDGTHEWETQTAGEVLAWAYVDKAQVEARSEPWR